MSADILIVDDEVDIRNLIEGLLEDEGYSTRQAKDSAEVYEAVSARVPSLVVLDIWLQGSKEDGLEILKSLKKSHPFLPVVMISGHGTIETAVSAIKDGAYDFVEKPFKSDRLLLMIRRALENAKLQKENAVLRRQALGPDVALIGHSPALQSAQQLIERVAPTNSRVLISGEPGTGKDIVARILHKKSLRSSGPFIVMNCATLRTENFEAELFGVEQGHRDEEARAGVLEQADGGTLLLDEVSDLSLETQGKVVRVLQDQRFFRLGGVNPIEVDVRVLATSHRNLEELMKLGQFRQDLFYRLNVVPLHMPALRDRNHDIPDLANYFLSFFLNRLDKPVRFSVAAQSLLRAHRWPGNIRQLRNMVEWVVIMNGHQNIEEFGPEHLPPEFFSEGRISSSSDGEYAVSINGYVSMPLREAREEFEREYLLAQVERFDGNISRTAQFVGMERSALHRKLKSLQIGADKDEASPPDQAEHKKRISV